MVFFVLNVIRAWRWPRLWNFAILILQSIYQVFAIHKLRVRACVLVFVHVHMRAYVLIHNLHLVGFFLRMVACACLNLTNHHLSGGKWDILFLTREKAVFSIQKQNPSLERKKREFDTFSCDI